MKKVVFLGVHVFLLLLSLINMFCVRMGSDYYEYMYIINDAISIIPHIDGFIAAFVCVFIFAVIDCIFVGYNVVKIIKGVMHKENITDQLLKTIHWCVMALMAITSVYVYFMYYIVFIT